MRRSKTVIRWSKPRPNKMKQFGVQIKECGGPDESGERNNGEDQEKSRQSKRMKRGTRRKSGKAQRGASRSGMPWASLRAF